MINNPELDEYKAEAVQLTAEIQGVFDQMPTQQQPERAYSVVFDEICHTVMERGILTEEQMWEIDKVADDVVKVFETAPTPESAGGDDTDPFSNMFDWYLGFEEQPLSRAAQREIARQDKDIDLQFKSFFGIIDQIRQGGDLLLSDELINPISDESVSVGSEHNANVLKTLAIVDVITTIHQARPLLDRGDVDNEGEKIPVETIESLFVGAVSESMGSKSDTKALHQLLDGEYRAHAKGMIFKRAPVHVKQQLHAIDDAARRYLVPRTAGHNLQKSYLKNANNSTYKVLEVLDKAQLLGLAFERIDELVAAELENNPDTNTLLGALAVENWRYDLLQGMDRRFLLSDGERADFRKVFSAWQTKRLHKSLEEADAQQKSQANREAIQTIDTEIEGIEAKFEITGKKLRELDGGIALRKNIMDIIDNGSERAAFTEQEAQLLAGLVLTMHSDEAFEEFRQAVAETGQLYQQKRALGGGRSLPPLFGAVMNVREMYEAGVLERLSHKSKETKNLELINKWLERLDAIDPNPSAEPPELPEPDEPADLAAGEPVSVREALQHTEIYLPIEPFPPGEVNVENITRDFKEAVERTRGSYVVEWERIEQFIGLHNKLVEEGHDVKFYRTKHSSWHPLPYYVIEVEQAHETPPIALAESPIWGNATYFIQDEGWQTIIQFTRQQARDHFGAKARSHPTENSYKEGYHTERLRQMIPPKWA